MYDRFWKNLKIFHGVQIHVVVFYTFISLCDADPAAVLKIDSGLLLYSIIMLSINGKRVTTQVLVRAHKQAHHTVQRTTSEPGKMQRCIGAGKFLANLILA